jgi:predicted SprT family Zn-dependent metalloprotease
MKISESGQLFSLVFMQQNGRQTAFVCRCGHQWFTTEYAKTDTRYTCKKCSNRYINIAGHITPEIKKPA